MVWFTDTWCPCGVGRTWCLFELWVVHTWMTSWYLHFTFMQSLQIILKPTKYLFKNSVKIAYRCCSVTIIFPIKLIAQPNWLYYQKVLYYVYVTTELIFWYTFKVWNLPLRFWCTKYCNYYTTKCNRYNSCVATNQNWR